MIAPSEISHAADGLKVSLLMLAFAGAFLRDAAAQSAEEREPPKLTREQWLAERVAAPERPDEDRETELCAACAVRP